jgi:hypothetical protein
MGESQKASLEEVKLDAVGVKNNNQQPLTTSFPS